MSKKVAGVLGVLILAAIVAGAFVLGVAGGDDGQETETDGAFVTEMVPHHESAIEMAEIAVKRAEHPEVEALANSIIATQSDEIAALDEVHVRLFDAPIGEVDHGTLGLAEHEMGMDTDVGALSSAKPFDREFIDMMILHHQGAIAMARVEIAQGGDEEARALAEQIIGAQTGEIEEMNAWRTEWYGSPSPAGGAPPADSAPAHEAMGH